MSTKFVLLLKKNLKHDLRSWKCLLLEILIITIAFLTISFYPHEVVFRSKLDRNELTKTKLKGNYTEITDLELLRLAMNVPPKSYGLMYTPIQETTRAIITQVSDTLDLDEAQGFDDASVDLLKMFNKNKSLAAVVFHEFNKDLLSITIRFPSQFRTLRKSEDCWDTACFWTTRYSGSLDVNNFEDSAKNDDLYIREGFLQIQHEIFKAWIKVYGNASKYQEIPSVVINSFLHDTSQEIYFPRKAINFVWWFFYNFLYFVPFLNLVWKISREREENILDHHWIYGFSYSQHRLAHFIISLLHLLALNMLIMAFLMIKWPSGPISNSNQTVNLFLFLLLYSGMLIVNAFIFGTLIGNAKTAVLFAATLWLASYSVLSTHLANATTIEPQVLLWLLIFFNNFLPVGLMYLEDHSEENIPNDIWLLLVVQTCSILFYWCCIQCWDSLKSGSYARSLNDARCYSKCNQNKKDMAQTEEYTTCADSKCSSYEYGPVDGHLLLLNNVSGCRQDNRNRNPVLKNISMRLFKDEISVILGPHGSGKTTLISILAGWHRYHGYIYYDDNKEISENWPYYSRHIDVSMPTNPLYDLLTVKEQLQYILLIKQLNSNATQFQIELNKWLMVLKTSIEDCTKLIRTLTFAQKRLVSLCCTLSGNSKIILLDEPTLHLGFDERRLYWRILRQEKLNRVIVMTTTSIDEANEIGDRLAILHNGSLVAWGTPFYLKHNLNKDIYLVLFLAPQTSIKPITLLLEKYVPTVVVHNQFSDRIIYILAGDKRDIFQRLLIDLEKMSNELGITNLYISGNELNDVYMHLTDRAEIKKPLPNVEKNFKFSNDPVAQQRDVQMTSALFYKKLLYQAPNVNPVIVMLLALLLIVLVHEMSKFFTLHDRIQMGIKPHIDAHEFLRSLDHCKYLEITAIDDMRGLQSNWRSHNWFIDKLKCGYAPYMEDIFKDVNIYNKLGAVERVDDKSHLKLWINEKIFHSAALTLNLAHNIILNDLYPNNKHAVVNINNEPIWEPARQKITLKHFNNLNVPLTLGIIMPLTVSSFIVMPIDERRNHMQILQRISGVNTIHFGLTNFIWDYAVYGILTLIYFLIMCAYTYQGFLWTSKLATLLILGVYGIASLPLVYTVFLYVSDHKLRGFLMLFLLQLIMGCIAFIVNWEVADKDSYYWYYMMLMIASPTFALLVGVSNVQVENMVRVYCHDRFGDCCCSLVQQCCSQSFFQWSFPGILPSLFFMLLSALILTINFIVTSVYRSNKKYSSPKRMRQMSSVCYPYDDERVIAEKVRISNMNMRQCKAHAVLVDQLEYEIPKWGNRVEAISFALKKHSCMGIYGPGKTQLIKQLIGQHAIHFGEVYICGGEIKRNIHKAIRNLGYCPQNNGFCEGSTPRQLFTLFFMLSGVTERTSYNQIRDLSLTLNLRQYMNTRISELPYHIRRRINVAITLIAHNKVLIFDEPTSGLAAHERHLLWNVIRQAKTSGSAVIFTSQDTVELEQLADFIIVVNNGEMLAIDSPQSMRQLYTRGFYLEIKLKSDGDTLEDVEVKNRHGHILKFYIPIENITYSYLFGTMEKNRQRLNIAEYMISQGALTTSIDNLRIARRNKVRYDKSKTMGVFD